MVGERWRVMPERAPRACRRNGCPELVRDASGLCEQHRKAEHADYNANRRPEEHKLYSTLLWRRTRMRCLVDHPFCERCGQIAEMVHHKVEHGGDVRLFCDPANLASLCQACHAAVHGARGNAKDVTNT